MLRTGSRPMYAVTAVLILLFIAAPTYAQLLSKTEVALNVSHSGPVSTIAFSADGTKLISGSIDKTIKLWDVATGHLIRTIQGEAPVLSVALSPDGRRVLTASEQTLRLWDLATGQPLHTLAPCQPQSVAYSPDGRYLLAGCAGGLLKLWDAATGRLLRSIGESGAPHPLSIAFSPDGKKIVSSARAANPELWDAATGRLLLRLSEGDAITINSAVFSSDGQRILSGSDDKASKLWDATTGQLLRTFAGRAQINSVAISRNGRFVISGEGDHGGTGYIQVWETTTGRLLQSFEDPRTVATVALSPDGRKGAFGTAGGEIKILDIATRKSTLQALGAGASVTTFAGFSPDGTVVAVGGDSIALWDSSTGRFLRRLKPDPASATYLAFSPDGKQLLSTNLEDDTLRLWSVAEGRVIHTFVGARGFSQAVFSPDGSRVLSGAQEYRLGLWDALTRRRLWTTPPRKYPGVRSVAFSTDGKYALSGSGWGSIELWEASVGRHIRSYEGFSDEVLSVAFSPDGKLVLATGIQKARLWDAFTGHLVSTFGAQFDNARLAAFSPDGRQILTSNRDMTLKLWDVATGNLLGTFEGRWPSVLSVAFSPDGKRVVVTSTDRTVGILSAVTGTLLATLVASDSDWLGLTREGFFTSRGGDSALLSVVRGLELTKIGQVHQSLVNPDLVREALAGDPGGEVGEAAKVVNLEQVLDSGPAPSNVIVSPAEGGRFFTDLVSVTARIEDRGGGVGRIEWRVNGVTAAVRAKPPGDRRLIYTVTKDLALDSGDNTIELVAYNGSNLLASLPARTTVKFTGPTDKARPKLHILAVGIDKYEDKEFAPPLDFAEKDATAFGESMQKAAAGLYDEVRVTPVLGPQATRANLERVIDRITADINPRDTFILFASGHGTSSKGRFYLIPQDYSSGATSLADGAIGQDQLQDWLANRIKARKAIILLDTCQSGALVAGHRSSRIAAPASEAGVGRLHEATGRPVLTAAAAGQAALEGVVGATGEKHGVFTWAVLDALRKGDTNGNGLIEVSELVAHVQSVVPKIAAEMGGNGRATIAEPVSDRQTARFGSRGDDFVVARRLP